MNLTRDRYAQIPIIDELVYGPTKWLRIESVRARNVIFCKPFIEAEMKGVEIFQRRFARVLFAR